jgi:hypothetical protein
MLHRDLDFDKKAVNSLGKKSAGSKAFDTHLNAFNELKKRLFFINY